MKIKIKLLVLMGVVFLVGFLGVVESADAGCCIIGAFPNARCEPPNPGCLVGSSDSRSCAEMVAGGLCVASVATPIPSSPASPTARTRSKVYFPGDDGSTDATGLPDSPDGIQGILKNLRGWLLGIIGVVGVISFSFSGIQYLMASGNDDMIKNAKNSLKYSIIGVIIALSGVVVIKAIDAMLNAKDAF